MVNGGERLDHYTTKVGGAPDWPPPSSSSLSSSSPHSPPSPHPPPPPSEMFSCGVCGAVMTLVAQAHAPVHVPGAPPSAADRTLYVFHCFDARCASGRGGAHARGRWRAVRAQRRVECAAEIAMVAAAETATATAAAATATTAAAAAATDDDWGAAGADDWGGGGGGKDDPADEEMDALAKALDAAASLAASEPSSSKGPKGPKGKDEKDDRDGDRAADVDEGLLATAARARRAWPAATLPEFYVVADREPDARAASAMTERERADTERLLASYAAAEGIAASSDAAAAAAAAAATKDWSGEAYENGADSSGLDKKYLKFSKRLRRAPEQCFRYAPPAHGGPGENACLWPTDGAAPETRATRCERCGGARVCELQLMPPLLHFVSEAAAWSAEGAGGAGAGTGREVPSDAIDAWDWQTVAAFACARACDDDGGGGGGGGGVTYAEEWVDVAEGDGGVGALLGFVPTAEMEEALAPAPAQECS